MNAVSFMTNGLLSPMQRYTLQVSGCFGHGSPGRSNCRPTLQCAEYRGLTVVSKNIWLIAGGALAAFVLLVWLSSGPAPESFGDEDWSSYGSDSRSDSRSDSIEPRSGTTEYMAGEILLEPVNEDRAALSSSDDTATAGVSPQDDGGLSPRELAQNAQRGRAQNAQQAAASAAVALHSSRRQMDRMRLLEAGFVPYQVDWIFERSDQLRDEFMQIYDGGAIGDNASLAWMDPDARLRAEIGEQEYTRYLEAIGRPRAVSVDRLVDR